MFLGNSFLTNVQSSSYSLMVPCCLYVVLLLVLRSLLLILLCSPLALSNVSDIASTNMLGTRA